MAASNIAVLTNSHRIVAAKKRAKRDQVKEVVFDEVARKYVWRWYVRNKFTDRLCREFLTGFHKRKVEKKEAAKKKAEEREKQERLEMRREVRRALFDLVLRYS